MCVSNKNQSCPERQWKSAIYIMLMNKRKRIALIPMAKEKLYIKNYFEWVHTNIFGNFCQDVFLLLKIKFYLLWFGTSKLVSVFFL